MSKCQFCKSDVPLAAIHVCSTSRLKERIEEFEKLIPVVTAMISDIEQYGTPDPDISMSIEMIKEFINEIF